MTVQFQTPVLYQRYWRKWSHLAYFPTWKQIQCLIICNQHTKNSTSTESALSKVENDVLLNMEKGRVTAFTLLDLSAAFDTIDHLTLINRLSSWYEISGTALDWFTSYLSDRCQQVKIQDFFLYISFGLPHCSVLGPILLTLYTAPLSQVIAQHDVEHHLYADDAHINISLSGFEAPVLLMFSLGWQTCS